MTIFKDNHIKKKQRKAISSLLLAFEAREGEKCIKTIAIRTGELLTWLQVGTWKSDVHGQTDEKEDAPT